MWIENEDLDTYNNNDEEIGKYYIHGKNTKRSRYLDGVKKAKKHWRILYDGKEPCSPNSRKEIASWINVDDRKDIEQAKKTLNDPGATFREKSFAAWLLKRVYKHCLNKRKNFGVFRSTRPALWKDKWWSERAYSAKQQRIDDRLNDLEEEFLKDVWFGEVN